jgi:hypothetical protein
MNTRFSSSRLPPISDSKICQHIGRNSNSLSSISKTSREWLSRNKILPECSHVILNSGPFESNQRSPLLTLEAYQMIQELIAQSFANKEPITLVYLVNQIEHFSRVSLSSNTRNTHSFIHSFVHSKSSSFRTSTKIWVNHSKFKARDDRFRNILFLLESNRTVPIGSKSERRNGSEYQGGMVRHHPATPTLTADSTSAACAPSPHIFWIAIYFDSPFSASHPPRFPPPIFSYL